MRKVIIKYKDVSDLYYPIYRQKTVVMDIPTDKYGFVLNDELDEKVREAARKAAGHEKCVVVSYGVHWLQE